MEIALCRRSADGAGSLGELLARKHEGAAMGLHLSAA